MVVQMDQFGLKPKCTLVKNKVAPVLN